jgi:selenocysteine lyase/cysteine desulfurase
MKQETRRGTSGAAYLDFVRKEVIGRDLAFRTPFGLRNIFYADYTASGRGLGFIERRLLEIQRSYANTHTEDDYSGKRLTSLLKQAEKKIKDYVNAGDRGKIIPVGSGSTGALQKLQEIIGVYIPPLTRERLGESGAAAPGKGDAGRGRSDGRRPVVFIGPYEHHTNELMWREAFAEVVVVNLASGGGLDLRDLERRLGDRRYAGRVKFGSFSAGSNITGVRTPVYEVARICHRHQTPVFFDFAAVAPYAELDMNRNAESYFDAVFFSPHKFLGGPGSSGVLVLREELYRKDLPPTTAGGGTVVYVGFDRQDYAEDIETREMAGTPPILQTIKAALAMEVRERIGLRTIERIEKQNLAFFLRRLSEIDNIQLVGRYDDADLTPIVSFNIRHKDGILHPKFVTRLLNDLFGIQSRAGCSCAGPYGHVLLGIDEKTSHRFRGLILRGLLGIKPGWVRVNVHYTFTKSDVDFLARAVAFAARHGQAFLHRYAFDFATGEWRPLDFSEPEPELDLDTGEEGQSVDLSRIRELRAGYFEKARALARSLERAGEPRWLRDPEDIEELKNFYYAHRA